MFAGGIMSLQLAFAPVFPHRFKRARRAVLNTCMVCAAFAGPGAGFVAAQGRTAAEYPSRVVRIIAPQAAGSGVDIYMRAIALKLGETWGQQVLIDNRPGANGIVGIEAVTKADPDGYTLVAGFTSVLAINPHVYKSLPYDPFRSLAPVMQTVTNTMALVVHPNLPVRSVKELVALAKSRPGSLMYGSNGIGNVTHLAGELLGIEAGIKMVHVPYKGATPAITDLSGGQVALLFATAADIAAQVRAARLRLLATCGEQRANVFPDAPTIVEAGLPGMVVTGWGGLLAPAGTPREVIEKIQRDAARHFQDPAMRERLKDVGAEPAVSTPDQFTAFLKSETGKWERVVRHAGIYHSQ
jgi:tripartite-type tricarboxylate transporter receptor subunit TctC